MEIPGIYLQDLSFYDEYHNIYDQGHKQIIYPCKYKNNPEERFKRHKIFNLFKDLWYDESNQIRLDARLTINEIYGSWIAGGKKLFTIERTYYQPMFLNAKAHY